jgi:DNA polymerase III delta prime subunit
MPGIGKTTSIHCLAHALLGDAYKEGVLELNASDERSDTLGSKEIGLNRAEVSTSSGTRSKALPNVKSPSRQGVTRSSFSTRRIRQWSPDPAYGLN